MPGKNIANIYFTTPFSSPELDFLKPVSSALPGVESLPKAARARADMPSIHADDSDKENIASQLHDVSDMEDDDEQDDNLSVTSAGKLNKIYHPTHQDFKPINSNGSALQQAPTDKDHPPLPTLEASAGLFDWDDGSLHNEDSVGPSTGNTSSHAGHSPQPTQQPLAVKKHSRYEEQDGDEDRDLGTAQSSREASSNNDTDDPVLTGSTNVPSQPKAKKRKTNRGAKSDVPMLMSSRELRQRKPEQERPYKAEKVAFETQKSKGRKPTEAELERAVAGEDTKVGHKKKAPVRAKRSVSILSEASSVASVVELDASAKMERTLLRITVPGEDMAIEVPSFSKVDTLSKLIDLTNRRWGAIKGASVDHLVCQRPWLGSGCGRNLLIFPDWDDQFEALVTSVLAAEIWRSKSSEPRLEVFIEAALKSKTSTPEAPAISTPHSSI